MEDTLTRKIKLTRRDVEETLEGVYSLKDAAFDWEENGVVITSEVSTVVKSTPAVEPYVAIRLPTENGWIHWTGGEPSPRTSSPKQTVEVLFSDLSRDAGIPVEFRWNHNDPGPGVRNIVAYRYTYDRT